MSQAANTTSTTRRRGMPRRTRAGFVDAPAGTPRNKQRIHGADELSARTNCLWVLPCTEKMFNGCNAGRVNQIRTTTSRAADELSPIFTAREVRRTQEEPLLPAV
jgi:hypothetical protein